MRLDFNQSIQAGYPNQTWQLMYMFLVVSQLNVFFDDLNRPYEGGLISGATLPDSLREFSDTSSTNHLQYTYIEDYIRTLNRKEVVRSYWDNDRFGLSLGLNQYNLKRRVASVAHYSGTLDTSDYYAYNHAIHYSYDIHGNVDTLVMDEPKLKCIGDSSLGFKVINYDYDLISGKVNKFEFNRGKPDQYFHKYTYDADNRLLEAFTSRNGSLWEQDARYFYYLHGPLARIEIGEAKVQGLDFVYSLHGWIKGVNSGSLRPECDAGKDGLSIDAGVGTPGYTPTGNIHSTVGRDVFGYTLGYYHEVHGLGDTLRDYKPVGRMISATNPKYYFEAGLFDGSSKSNLLDSISSLFNGNISRMVTAIDFRKDKIVADTTLGYGYHYDQLNRLSAMDVYSNLNKAGSDNHWGYNSGLHHIKFNNGVVDPSSMNRPYQTAYSYDGAGNILNLYRNGGVNHGVGVSSDYRMDVFKYNYIPNTNKLRSVDDDTSLTIRYKEDLDDQDTANYEYDEIGQMVKDSLKGVLDIQWNRFNKPLEVKYVSKPTLYYGYDGAGNKIYKKLGNKETFYLKDASGNILSLYEKYEAGDTISSLDTLIDQHRFLTELIPSYGGSCGDNLDDFFDEYVKPECRKDGLSSAYSFARFYYCFFPSADYWFNIVKPYVDWECVGINLYQKDNFSIDTTYLGDLLKNRYKVLARSEAYLYGSSRLGIDTEKKILADSLDFGRYIYNPFCYLYQRLGDIDTTKDSYAVLNDSLVRYNEAGWKRYEFSNHLGNVLAVTSDRKIATDTLSGAGSGADYYYADLFSVNDYDPFGMVQPGRSWKRKENSRFGFNGKENEEWEVQDYGFRYYDFLTGRFISVDPLTDDYPWYTPFQFAGNTPIQAVDLDGLEPGYTNDAGYHISGSDHTHNGNPKFTPNKVVETQKREQVAAKVQATANAKSQTFVGPAKFTPLQQKQNEFKRTLQLKLESDPVSFGKPGTNASLVEGLGIGATAVTGEVMMAKAFTLGINTFNRASKFIDGYRKIPVYRGTSNVLETDVFNETGYLMSDAAKISYQESGSINSAFRSSTETHNAYIKLWWNDENTYVQAHGLWGSELSESFGIQRSMISVTTKEKTAHYFANVNGPGKVYFANIRKKDLIKQTLPGSGENEYLIKHMSNKFKPTN